LDFLLYPGQGSCGRIRKRFRLSKPLQSHLPRWLPRAPQEAQPEPLNLVSGVLQRLLSFRNWLRPLASAHTRVRTAQARGASQQGVGRLFQHGDGDFFDGIHGDLITAGRKKAVGKKAKENTLSLVFMRVQSMCRSTTLHT
jgi:hypothetical protein